MKPKLWVLAGVGVAAMVGAVYLAAHQSSSRPTEPDAVLTVVLGASLLGSGLASWRARPENRLGPVMVLTAFGFFASQLTEATPAWMYTVGTAVQYFWLTGFLYLLLTFPSGRLLGAARPLADGGRGRAAVPPDPGDARRQQGGPALSRLPGQPDPDRPPQPGGAQPPQPPAAGGLDPARRDRLRDHSALDAGRLGPPARGGAGTGGRMRHIPRARPHRHARPVRRSAQRPARPRLLLPGRDRADRRHVRVPPAATGARWRGRAGRRAGDAGRLRRPAPGAGPHAGRPLARARLLVPRRALLRRRRRRPGAAPRRRQRSARHAGRARRPADRRAAARCLSGRRRRARAIGVRRGQPRAGERTPPGRAAGTAGGPAGLAGAAGRGHRRRAPADRARPARRHPAAAGVHRDVARAAGVQAAGAGGRGAAAAARDACRR